MFWVTNLGYGISQSCIPAMLKYNVEVYSGASGWVAQILPVGWNGIPGVHDFHVAPRCDWRCDVGEGHCREEKGQKDPEALHGCGEVSQE